MDDACVWEAPNREIDKWLNVLNQTWQRSDNLFEDDELHAEFEDGFLNDQGYLLVDLHEVDPLAPMSLPRQKVCQRVQFLGLLGFFWGLSDLLDRSATVQALFFSHIGSTHPVEVVSWFETHFEILPDLDGEGSPFVVQDCLGAAQTFRGSLVSRLLGVAACLRGRHPWTRLVLGIPNLKQVDLCLHMETFWLEVFYGGSWQVLDLSLRWATRPRSLQVAWAFRDGGFKEVTSRYVGPQAYQKRGDWTSFMGRLRDYGFTCRRPRHALGGILEKLDDLDMRTKQIRREPKRLTTKGAFLHSPRYVLPSCLKANEVLRPASTLVGVFKGEPFYRRADVSPLRTVLQWKLRSRAIKEGEVPQKCLRQLKSNEMVREIQKRKSIKRKLTRQEVAPIQDIPVNEHLFRESLFYGDWQTQPLILQVVNGVLPKTHGGVVELLGKIRMPEGTTSVFTRFFRWKKETTLDYQGDLSLWKLAAVQNQVEWAPLVLDYRWDPNLRKKVAMARGLLLLESDQPKVLETYVSLLKARRQAEQQAVASKIRIHWRLLLKSLMAQQYVDTLFG